MTPVQTIRQDILNILALTGAEKIAFDTMDAGEIESVDKLADVDDATSGKVRHAMLQRVVYETDDSPDYKIAQVTITAGISDYA